MEWYYANESGEQVAVTETELKTLVEGGIVRGETLVWREGMAEWQACRAVQPDWFAAAAPAGGVNLGGPPPPPLYFPPQLPAATPQADGLSIASMVLGIAGLVFMLCYFMGLPFSIGAVICGHLARKQQKLRDEPAAGAGMAMAGLITGYIGIGLVVLIVGFVVIMLALGIATSGVESPNP